MIQQKYLTKEQALQKAKHYCGYQERNHSEVKEKLYSLGLWKKDVEEIISTLIEENYLNEDRFAIQYARGKFGLKRWGRVKIKYALKQKQVSVHSIKNAMDQIAENDYQKTLNKLAEQKLKTLKSEKDIFNKKRKLRDYLLQKGYEETRIRKVLVNIE